MLSFQKRNLRRVCRRCRSGDTAESPAHAQDGTAGMIPIAAVLRSLSGQYFLYQSGQLLIIRPAGQFLRSGSHHLAHVLHAGGARFSDN